MRGSEKTAVDALPDRDSWPRRMRRTAASRSTHTDDWSRFSSARARPGARVDRTKLRQIDLRWHDLRHEGADRLLSDGVDIRTIQLMLGHADIKQTQRCLNITDEELRKAKGR